MKLSCSEFAQMYEKSSSSNRILLDVRNPDEVALGSLPQCVLIPLSELDKRASELSSTKEIFIYCKAGGRSEKASFYLSQIGFTKTRYAADGGYDELKELIKK